jgi:hypothetical protein
VTNVRMKRTTCRRTGIGRGDAGITYAGDELFPKPISGSAG